MKKHKVLIVEDQASVRRLLADQLRGQGYQVDEAWSLAGARRCLPLLKPDLLILDLTLDDGDGYELLRDPALRKIPTLVISARAEIIDRIVSLELGAEDYMVKPVDTRELVLRLRRLIKLTPSFKDARSQSDPASQMDFGSFKLDLINRTIVKDDASTAQLTAAEFRLLRLLASKPGQVVDRPTIAKMAIGRQWTEHSRAIDVLVSKLRKKIDEPEHASWIRNMRGAGYVFRLSAVGQKPEAEAEDDELLQEAV